MRTIKQPGTEAVNRIQWVQAGGRPIRVELRQGTTLLESVKRGFAAEGSDSGCLRLENIAFGPFGYLMPALPNNNEHVAYYSEMFRPQGTTEVRAVTLTLGMRNDQPFFHAHGHWIEADGRRGGGHLAPEETFIAKTVTIDAFALDNAAFKTKFDEETRFPLFSPERTASASVPAPARNVFAIRLLPNMDISLALEQFCRERGISRATLHGGVGSLIGARFENGHVVEPFITEVAITSGNIIADSYDKDRTQISAVMVDHTGQISEGWLTRGQNPVLITFEIVLEANAFL